MPAKRRKKLRRDQAPPAGAARPRDTFTVERLDQLKALTHPLRQQLLEQFAGEPRTTKQAAVRMGEKITRLYHHVAALEQAGLIRLVATRPVRGTTEKYYATVAHQVRIDPALLAGEESKSAVYAAGLDVVDGVLGNVRRDVANLLTSADRDCAGKEDEVLFMQVDITGGAAEARRIRARIDRLLRDLGARRASDTGAGADRPSHRMLVGWYPCAAREPSGQED